MFDIFGMGNWCNYEERKLEHYEQDGIIVDTARVTDSTDPIETAVIHPEYNEGKWMIVETYKTVSDAEEGHRRWVELMTKGPLPDEIIERSTAAAIEIVDMISDDFAHRTHHRIPKE